MLKGLFNQMKSRSRTAWGVSQISACLLTAMIFAPLAAEDDKKEKKLDVKQKNVKRLESNQTFGGYTKTSLFYTFPTEKVILRILIDNQSEKFPISGVIYTFKPETTVEGMKKWINNQTSDALFPDVPLPTAKKELGKGIGKITSRKKKESVKTPFGLFDKYDVEFQFSRMGLVSGYSIRPFSEKASVYMKRP